MGESTVPNMGVVVQQLVQCVDHHHREKTALDLLSRKLSSIPNMNSTELKEVCHYSYYNYRTVLFTCVISPSQNVLPPSLYGGFSFVF
jgi:hypothetical protein